MPYPQIVDYNEAVQNPATAFSDPELRQGFVVENSLGLPLALSGGFALTYTVITPSKRKYAVRCFHRQVPSAEQRYRLISQKLRAVNSPFFVSFDFQPNGIRVKGATYPIVRMDWVEGDTLGVYLDKKTKDASALRQLRTHFQSLSDFLTSSDIAHGDIQNGNVIVTPSGLRLIDYDGVYVSGLPIGQGSESGHKHFQHPQRTEANYGPRMDRFPFVAVDLSLQALIEDASLHQRYREGGETIIFKANDYIDPEYSEVFRTLASRAPLKTPADHFSAVCRATIDEVPSLSDFLSGRNIPTPKPAILISRPSAVSAKPQPVGYISAFDVLDARGFDAFMHRVGDRVELVGQIFALKHGIGKRGKGRGRPYVFINFAHWRGNIVKLTIWSEGLSRLGQTPSDAWVGKWVSVVGLVDAPYSGKHYAFRYTHVGITITDPGQINFISEKEAKYRLAGVGRAAGSGSNRDIFEQIEERAKNSGATSASASLRSALGRGKSSAGSPLESSNAAIMARIKAAQSTPSFPRGKSSPTKFSPPTVGQPTSPQRKIPIWIWWVAAAIGFYLLMRFKR